MPSTTGANRTATPSAAQPSPATRECPRTEDRGRGWRGRHGASTARRLGRGGSRRLPFSAPTPLGHGVAGLEPLPAIVLLAPRPEVGVAPRSGSRGGVVRLGMVVPVRAIAGWSASNRLSVPGGRGSSLRTIDPGSRPSPPVFAAWDAAWPRCAASSPVATYVIPVRSPVTGSAVGSTSADTEA
jgi:hypothetical protein